MNYYLQLRTKCEFNGGTAKDTWSELIELESPLLINSRFDEELDTGEATWTSQTDTIIDKWQKIRIFEENNLLGEYWVDECIVETLTFGSPRLWKKTIKFIELTKVLQKIVMDNLTDSQPLSGTKRTVRDVLERLIRLMFTLPVLDYAKRPLHIALDQDIAGLDRISPEFFFTEKTAFECFVEVGEFIGAFPKLLPRNDGDSGSYVLTFIQWDNPNVDKYNADSVQSKRHFSGIDNYAANVESYAKNMLLSSGSGEDELVYPAPGAYKLLNADEKDTEVTSNNGKFTLPENIYKIKKAKLKCKLKNLTNTKEFDIDVTSQIVEYTKWLVLTRKAYEPLSRYDIGKNSVCYYNYNESAISFPQAEKEFQFLIWQANAFLGFPYSAGADGSGAFLTPQWMPSIDSVSLSVTYIPLISARVKTKKTEANLPITQIVNQTSNVLKSTSFANYLQGLNNRMTGEYYVYEMKVGSYRVIPKVGSTVDDLILVATDSAIISGDCVEVQLLLSKEFNRRSPFVSIEKEPRQWAIPADGKVTDRYIHYGEMCRVSINEPLTDIKDNSSITTTGKNLFLNSFRGIESSNPSISYIKMNNYGVLSCSCAQFGQSLLYAFSAKDNASLGNRTYDPFNTLDENTVGKKVQEFIDYGGENLDLFISNQYFASTVIDGYTNFTGATREWRETSFSQAFPAISASSFSSMRGAAIFDFGIFVLQKDTRERMIFNYQLVFSSQNNTLVGDVSKVGLVSNRRYSSYKLYLSNSEKYSPWDTAPKGTLISTITPSSVSVSGNRLSFNFPNVARSYESLAITDENNRIIFATSAPGIMRDKVEVFFDFCKEEKTPM